MSNSSWRDDEKAETAGMWVGVAAYQLAKLAYTVPTAVVCGLCLWMLVTYVFTENRRVSLPKWLLLMALAVANVYSHPFLAGLLTPLLTEGVARVVSTVVIAGSILALPRPTGEVVYERLSRRGGGNAKGLPPPTLP